MQIIIHDNVQEVSVNTLRSIQALVRDKARPVLGLATGSTPINLYQNE